MINKSPALSTGGGEKDIHKTGWINRHTLGHSTIPSLGTNRALSNGVQFVPNSSTVLTNQNHVLLT